MEKYAVFCYNIGGYEIMHPVQDPSPNCHYVYVTDDETIKTDGVWDVKYVKDLEGTAWDKCCYLRYHPFEYCSEDVVVRIDGSIGITKNLDPLVNRFLKGNNNGEPYDFSFMIHPGRNTMIQEYQAWVGLRGYPIEQATKCLNMMANNGYDVNNYKNLIQLCFEIDRRSSKNCQDYLSLTYAYVKMLGDTECERLDQTISSFILDKHFQTSSIMLVDNRIVQCDYLQWYQHNTNTPFAKMDVKNMLEPYLFNKRVHNIVRPQDL